MVVKSLAAAIAATALLANVASAQTPSNNANVNHTSPSTAPESSFRGDWRTSKVVGLSVYDNNNDSVGTINDLLTDRSGNIKAVVLGVGGLLGVGEHLVAVPFDRVKFVDQPVSSTSASGTRPSSPASTTTTGSSTSSNANEWYPDHAVFNATKDELKAMPEFKYSS